MRVNHFNTYPHGGAAIAARSLHRTLREFNFESNFYYWLNDQTFPPDSSIQLVETRHPRTMSWLNPLARRAERNRRRRICNFYDRHLAKRTNAFDSYSMAEQLDPLRLDWQRMPSDIIHLHWIAYLADYPTFFGSMPSDRPVIWTLHDMNPITGGCHFVGACRRFEKACGECPQVADASEFDISRHSFEIKQKTLHGRKIHVVTPSHWLNRLAQKSPIWSDETTFTVIGYGLDLRMFQPVQKEMARRQLGIESTSTVVGFGADNLANRRKGFSELMAALAARSGSSIDVVLFGSGSTPEKVPGVRQIFTMGFVNDQHRQSLIYSACDFMISPSLQDNLPQVCLEAMACGTPVVAFNSGGIGDVIQDGANGRLVENGNVLLLTRAVEWMIANREACSVMGRRARLTVTENYSATEQAQKYLALYERALSLASRSRAA